jgi:hypothetical protein
MNMHSKRARSTLGVVAIVAAVPLLCGLAIAQQEKVNGVISGRSGSTMTLQTEGSGR